MTQDRTFETIRTVWQEITLTVSHEVRWLSLESAGVAHLQIESIGPVRLQITESGYRSHFVSPNEIALAGGPVAHAVAWLACMAQSQEWKTSAAAKPFLDRIVGKARGPTRYSR